ncbi:hypothetical protein BgramDRAFT_6125 [Paraburkholderia graminis C4D1M]|uniref:Uncharacterized protein n=1 Tax=Paraburkholderia graminis (strain ATCC 700544 / DSM 17151 / LMG 18924 / NCIMB 13744 / C4D1M) TaxID=396598 RepID=B1G9V5_PARG4|nr:hypothetical protein BgramDRAFT_6125 [Paraburkholderia graminis C4D1M]
MLGGCPLASDADRIGTRGRQLASRPRYIELTYLSRIEAALDEFQRVLTQRYRLTIETKLRIEFAKLKVVLSDVSL